MMVTASEMGRKGGKAKSEAKTAAARKNAAKPRGQWWSAIGYVLDGVPAPFDFGVLLVRGKGPSGPAHIDWVREKLREQGAGLRDVERIEFLQCSVASRKL